jgi:hypothetical protein
VCCSHLEAEIAPHEPASPFLPTQSRVETQLAALTLACDRIYPQPSAHTADNGAPLQLPLHLSLAQTFAIPPRCHQTAASICTETATWLLPPHHNNHRDALLWLQTQRACIHDRLHIDLPNSTNFATSTPSQWQTHRSITGHSHDARTNITTERNPWFQVHSPPCGTNCKS